MAARHVRKRSKIWASSAALLAAATLLIGTVAEAASGSRPLARPATVPTAATTTATVDPYALQGDFTAAAAEFHVPVEVLLAVSYQETLWESHQGEPSSTGNYNVMGLTEVEASQVVPATKAQKESDLEAFGDGRKMPTPSAKVLAGIDTVNTAVPALHTLDVAAALLKQPASALRGSMKQSVRGGAALLASYQRKLQGSLPTDPGAWYAAVAEYDQASDLGTADQFANRVYATISGGAARTTADGQIVALAADPSVVPQTAEAHSLAMAPQAATSATAPPTQCPSGMACTFDLANDEKYDAANRPADGDTVRYIVIHDTEASAASTINSFTSPDAPYVAAHYVVAANGAVTQLVPDQDTGIHADNKTVNMHSIGIENEGYALQNGSWFSEQEYESASELVKYLAGQFDIPLDRDHIIGHDEVPYTFDDPSLGQNNPVVTQHVDPGTYWDWGHFLSLVGAPISGDGEAVVGGTVTIAPPYSSAYEPPVTGCVTHAATCSARPADFVYLRTGPSTSYPLLGDSLLKSVGMDSGSTNGGDVSDKADYGQTFVVAPGTTGDWTAIWYGGQEAYFYNPGGEYTYANSTPDQTLVTPVGSKAVQVYGRAYPEASAYPASQAAFGATAAQGIDYKDLPYTIPAGQAYVTAGEVTGDYYQYNGTYNAKDTDCASAADQCEIIGKTQYYQINYDHRLGFVKATDVQVITAATPPTGTYTPVTPTRVLDTRNAAGGYKPLGSGSTLSLPVTGDGVVPPLTAGVTAVVMNVTADSQKSAGWMTVYPDGESRPSTSNLNFPAWRVIPNLVTVPVVNGRVDFYNNSGTVNVWADVVGYYTSSGTGSRLTSFGPVRVMDTRYGTNVARGPVGPGGHVTLDVAAVAGAPTNITAVVMNVTATGATGDTWVTVYPDSPTTGASVVPNTSTLNISPGRTTPNLAIVPVNDGKVDFYNALGTVNLFADITGYFTGNPTGGVLHTLNPTRLLDTRYGIGGVSKPVGPGATIGLQVAGNSGIPLKGVTAVVMNVTATAPTASSWVIVYPDGESRPSTSNLNFGPGVTVPNLVIVPVVDGRVDLYNQNGSVNLFADVTGFFTAN